MQNVKRLEQHIKHSLLSPRAYLLPIRFFLAIGWLRAAAEKLFSPEWMSGQALLDFLVVAQVATSFAFYGRLIERVFIPNIGALSFLIPAGQGAVGLALLFGVLSQAALLGALFMNLNFILAGVVNPSAFYVMMELLLLSSHGGAVLGLDAYLSNYIKQPWLVAQKEATQDGRVLRFRMWRRFITAGLLLLLGIAIFVHVKSFSPADSVKDPAMLLYVLSLFAVLQLFICGVQAKYRLNQLEVIKPPLVNEAPGRSKSFG